MFQIITTLLVSVIASPCISLVATADDKATDYANVKTAKEAIEVCKRGLVNDGKGEDAALLSEASVRNAIATAIKSYESLIETKPLPDLPGREKHFREVIKPVLMKVVDTGVWPKGCSFFTFYDLRDADSNVYNGLGLRLQVDTPDQPIKGFALPILDVFYGRFPR